MKRKSTLTLGAYEASKKWDITERRINVLCKDGRIFGAYKENNRWIIPAGAVKPADKRLKGWCHMFPTINLRETYTLRIIGTKFRM